MNKDKKLEIMRKRNTELNNRLKDTEFMIQYTKFNNQNGYYSAKQLIYELNDIKEKWIEALAELEQERDEYQNVVSDIKKIREKMKKKNSIFSLFRK